MGKTRNLSCKVCGGKHDWVVDDGILNGNPGKLWLEEAGRNDPESSLGPCDNYLVVGGEW